MSLHKFPKSRDWLSSRLEVVPAPFSNFCIDTRPLLTLSFWFVLRRALRLDRNQGSAERVTHQASQAVMWCGFDENLEQGARCSR
jgi:hypothetical protein